MIRSRLLPCLLLALALAIGAAPPPAFAISLEEAKNAGYVGERFDGYLALVDPNAPPEVRSLVEDVNARRRARYAEIAEKRGVSADVVGKLTAEKVINEAPAGTFIMGPKGGWERR